MSFATFSAVSRPELSARRNGPIGTSFASVSALSISSTSVPVSSW